MLSRPFTQERDERNLWQFSSQIIILNLLIIPFYYWQETTKKEWRRGKQAGEVDDDDYHHHHHHHHSSYNSWRWDPEQEDTRTKEERQGIQNEVVRWNKNAFSQWKDFYPFSQVSCLFAFISFNSLSIFWLTDWHERKKSLVVHESRSSSSHF